MTKTPLFLIALASALTLAACSNSSNGEHAEAEARASSRGLPTGNIQAGLQLATKGADGIAACSSCHGAEGNAPIDGMYPKLGGQYADYIGHALQAYRSGDRAGGTADIMGAQAKGLSDQQIADVAAYFGSVSTKLRDLQHAN